MMDSLRIAVRPAPGELQVYKDASWARTPTEMIEDGVLRALEDSGSIPAVARQGSGIGADYKLVMDLRHFEADYAGAAVPSAVIEVNAKLLHSHDQSVVASRTFREAVPAAGTDVSLVADAFTRALGDNHARHRGLAAHDRTGARNAASERQTVSSVFGIHPADLPPPSKPRKIGPLAGLPGRVA